MKKTTLTMNKQKELFHKLSLVRWKDELTMLSAKTGIELAQVCDYLGLTYQRDIGFYAKIPRRRRVMIGIGMAYKLPLEEINRWLVQYGNHMRLYAKNMKEDLVWIYLISKNCEDHSSDINYYKLYESCLEQVDEIYQQYWMDATGLKLDTQGVERSVKKLPFDPAFAGLKGFVIDHVEDLRQAYIHPRKLLQRYTSNILRTRSGLENTGSMEMNSLRGFLDDSMINYLSGSSETIHVLDMKTGKRSARIKAVPRRKKTHITMCLALGMTEEDINEYLDLMGYGALDADDPEERMLLKMLQLWESEHPQQRRYKKQYIYADEAERDDRSEFSEEKETEEDDRIGFSDEKEPERPALLGEKDEVQAVRDMLRLRQDLKEEYQKRGEPFPYINE